MTLEISIQDLAKPQPISSDLAQSLKIDLAPSAQPGEPLTADFVSVDAPTVGRVHFDNPNNPTENDLKTLATFPASEHFELRDGKIAPKFKPIRELIKEPSGRVDYGWNDEMRVKHLKAAYARGWEQFPYRPAHDGVVHIVGGGPSLRRCLPALRKFARKKKHFVLALNKTHDFLHNLRSLGYGEPIKCWGAVLLDPCDWVKDYITPRPGVQYFIADQCAPQTFDVFENTDISKWVWRSTNPRKDQDIPAKNMLFVPGGSTVGLRAKSLMYYCGFRTMHLWGFDSSAEVSAERPDGKMHGYDKVESVKDRVSVKIKDEQGFERDFVTNSHMARQAQEYIELREEWIEETKRGRVHWVHDIFHGDGLLPTIAARMGLHADKSINFIKDMKTLIPGELSQANDQGEMKHAG